MEHTTITMDKYVHKRLKAFCGKNNIKISQFITEAVEDKLAYYEFYEEMDPTEWDTDIEIQNAADGIRELIEKLRRGDVEDD